MRTTRGGRGDAAGVTTVWSTTRCPSACVSACEAATGDADASRQGMNRGNALPAQRLKALRIPGSVCVTKRQAEHKTAPVVLDDGFERFWAEYPRHASKKDAQKAWRLLAPSSDLVEKILRAVCWQKTTPQWTQEGRSFVPYAATWLRGERWEDEPFDTRPQLGKLSSRMAALIASTRPGDSDDDV